MADFLSDTVMLSRLQFAVMALAHISFTAVSVGSLASALYLSVIPPALTMFDAAAPVRSLFFLLVVSVVLLPVMLAYNAWLYRLFGGNTGGDAQTEDRQY